MTRLPAPLLRSLSVLGLGAALTLGHIAFAAAAPRQSIQMASATNLAAVADPQTTGSIGPAGELAENCYVEVVRERTAAGKTVTRRIHECD